MKFRFIRHVSRQLWDQYPLGTRLAWTFVFREVIQNRNILANSTKMFGFLMSHFIMIWAVLVVLWAGKLHHEVIYPPAPPEKGARMVYYAIAFPIAYILVGMCGVVLVAETIVVLVTLPLIAFAVVGTWALAVVLLFLLWFGLYRVPLYEYIYPALKTQILKQNSAMYQSLPSHTPTIRIVRLRPGEQRNPIICVL
ncbi:hypothetical protein E8E11_007596 [Didymella keratinophila]|nr:hypothetical protein E8E11_007596 [Didymella keratinophila]